MRERLTLLTTDPDSLIYDSGDGCEDCPDINLDPPSKSQCPYFDVRSGIPICLRDDGMVKKLEDHMKSFNLG
jgi:hypothetical protein